jgi:Holliday junction resolvase RusA-like endonuclease
MIRFIVPAVPVAQPRPRATLSPGGKHARVHEVTHIKDANGRRRQHPIAAFKAAVGTAYNAACKAPPAMGPLSVLLVFVMPRTKGLIWKTKPMPRMPHAKKPDADNLCKAATDALLGIAYVDDSQIADLRVQKWIAAGDEQPHVEVTIGSLTTEKLGA